MHSFDSCSDIYSSFHLRGRELDSNGGVADSEEFLQSAENGIRRLDSADIICCMYNGMKGSNVSVMCDNNNLESASSTLTCHLNGGLTVSDSGDDGGGGGVEVVADQKKEKDEVASGYNLDHSISGRGIGTFEADHARWRGEHQRLIGHLRSALNYINRNDKELNMLVVGIVSHYGELLRIKKAGARSDMFHILSGVWRTPAERCLMWLGGFRPSDLLKVVEKEIEPLSEEESVGICKLQQSCLQAEDALSQGMNTLIHHSLFPSLSSPNLLNYANQMATAITTMENIQNFLNQADVLRLHSMQELQRILTAHQAARAIIAIDDYKSRLRVLSSLWNNWANNVTLK